MNSLMWKDPQSLQKGMTLASRISLEDSLFVAEYNDLIKTLLGGNIDY